MTTSTLQISAKSLAEVAMPDFCPRCFWFKLRVKRLPFQVFPGIFSSIDSYSKKVVHGWLDDAGRAPAWLADLGDITGYYPPPHYSKFSVVDGQTNIKLTGAPDGFLKRADQSYVIVDYKTAKFTDAQDQLYPLYVAQLNAYALISRHVGPAPISDLALIYFEPVTHEAAAKETAHRRATGMAMDFEAHIRKVALNPSMIGSLLRTAREIFDSVAPPAGQTGCQDCQSLNALIEIAGPG